MKKQKIAKVSISVSFLFLVGFFLLPNLFNEREETAFSDRVRLEEAQGKYAVETVSDSVEIVPGLFYRRKEFIEFLLGSNYRKLWQQEIKVPVLNLKKSHGGLSPVEFSGGQQTIGIEVTDSNGRIWSIRSVNKDQSKALSGFWQLSLLRPLYRDQASALNPYASLAVAELAEAIEIHHSNRELFLFPYDTTWGKFNERMAGRLVILEEEADEGWAGQPQFDNASSILDTDEMRRVVQSKNIPIDTLLYARSRLFDMLISDWDRHEGNWKWAVYKNANGSIIEPIPVDRDMAFYNFGKGAINQVILNFVEKFQSFTPEYENIKGLMHQSEEMDIAILSGLEKQAFIHQAEFIQKALTDQIIRSAFKNYPDAAYDFIGKKHERILKARLKKLPQVAEKFYELIQKQ